MAYKFKRRYKKYLRGYNRRSMYRYRRKYWNRNKYRRRYINKAIYNARILKPEHKQLSFTQTGVTLTNNYSASTVVACVQGTANTNRIGRTIRVLSIFFRYQVLMNTSAADTLVRQCIVVDKQPNNAEPTAGEVFADTNFPAILTTAYNWASIQARRFNILYDRIDKLISTSNTELVVGQFYKKCNLEVTYDGNAGTIADVLKNNIAIIQFTNEPTNQPVIYSFIRIMFVDP